MTNLVLMEAHQLELLQIVHAIALQDSEETLVRMHKIVLLELMAINA